jgi:uncharacterized membrane protein YgcG
VAKQSKTKQKQKQNKKQNNNNKTNKSMLRQRMQLHGATSLNSWFLSLQFGLKVSASATPPPTKLGTMSNGDSHMAYSAPAPKAPPAQLAEATDEQVQPGLSFINGFMMDPGFLLSVQKQGLHMIAEVLGFGQARMQSRTNEQWRQIIADKWEELSHKSDYDQVMFKSWLLEVMKKDDFLKNMKVDAMWYERQDVLRRLLGIHLQFGALDMIVCKIKELPEIQLPDKDGGSGTDQDEADYVRLIKDMWSGGGSVGSAGNTGGGSGSAGSAGNTGGGSSSGGGGNAGSGNKKEQSEEEEDDDDGSS